MRIRFFLAQPLQIHDQVACHGLFQAQKLMYRDQQHIQLFPQLVHQCILRYLGRLAQIDLLF